MKQKNKEQVRRRTTQILAIILGALMVVGAIITLLVTILPKPTLEKYVDKKLRLVSVICDWDPSSSSLTSQDKVRILADLREKSGKKNASEEQLLEWYANQIKKDLKKDGKLVFSSDISSTGDHIARKGNNTYEYSIATKTDGSYSSFSLRGAGTLLNGSYSINESHGNKLMHISYVGYTYTLNGEEIKVNNAFRLEFFYGK